MIESEREATFFNGRPRRAKRQSNSINMKILAITVIFTALIASVTGGAIVSYTVQGNLDQILQSLPSPTPTVDTQTNSNNQLGNTSITYQIPPNATSTIATKSTTASSSDHSQHHPSDSKTTGVEDMYAMMESMDMYELMQNGTMDDIMTEMMPGMIALMSDNMKSMMMEMMLGNLTSQNGMVNQSMIQETDKMLQIMDKSLTIMNTIANASIANGNISNETLTLITGSINQIVNMMDHLMQMINTTTSNSSMTSMNTSVDAVNSGNNPQLITNNTNNPQQISVPLDEKIGDSFSNSTFAWPAIGG